jgi:hypothetical protein
VSVRLSRSGAVVVRRSVLAQSCQLCRSLPRRAIDKGRYSRERPLICVPRVVTTVLSGGWRGNVGESGRRGSHDVVGADSCKAKASAWLPTEVDKAPHLLADAPRVRAGQDWRLDRPAV